jgi:acetyl-CoA acyltransferase
MFLGNCNRYCASGLETISMATAKIQSGMAHCIIAGGAEHEFYSDGRLQTNSGLCCCKSRKRITRGMGLTEAVAQQFKVSREDQDEFAYNSHLKALKAQAEGKFDKQIVPITVEQTFFNENGKRN